jgi:hypothetical protein
VLIGAEQRLQEEVECLLDFPIAFFVLGGLQIRLYRLFVWQIAQTLDEFPEAVHDVCTVVAFSVQCSCQIEAMPWLISCHLCQPGVLTAQPPRPGQTQLSCVSTTDHGPWTNISYFIQHLLV